jgi:hypothetical protein
MQSYSMNRMARLGPERIEAVDVVVLTVIPVELEAARRVLRIDDARRQKEADGTVYFRGMVPSDAGAILAHRRRAHGTGWQQLAV